MGELESSTTQARGSNADPVKCPWCGSDEVERIGFFGPQLMGEPYICRRCHSPFERIRQQGEHEQS